MKYKGSNLKRFVNEHRGMYTQICETMLGGKKGLDSYYHDDKNVRIETLSKLMKATGMPLSYFVEMEPGEVSGLSNGDVGNNNNIIQNFVGNDLSKEVDHLTTVIKLKDELLQEKERLIIFKDSVIESWKKKYDDLIKLAREKSGESQT